MNGSSLRSRSFLAFEGISLPLPGDSSQCKYLELLWLLPAVVVGYDLLWSVYCGLMEVRKMGVFIGVGYGQASLVMNATGTSWNQVVTWGFKDTAGTGSPSAALAAIGPVATGTGKFFNGANISSQYSLVRLDVTIGTASGPVIGTTAYGVTGTASLNSPPANCAILCSKATARGGRRGRGRMFISPAFVDEGNVGASGTIAAGTLAALQTKITTLLSDLAGTAYPMYLLHDSSEVAPDAVTVLTLQSRMATQRTRMRK